jgi:hypothetical protein
VNPCGEAASAGEVGEIHVRTPYLAFGYHRRPAASAQRFTPDSFTPGGRVYRTGDLARRHADGSIEFLGRLDHQVKIRGHRIELDEITTVLNQHPSVATSAVVAHPQRDGSPQLVAYLVASTQPAPAAEQLRAHLATVLPEHMIPSHFLTLERLPSTPNGKLDRGALPPPDASRPATGAAYVSPSTPLHHLLADIWTDILDGGPVGIHDGFFALGGHSLLATRVVARIRESLGIELPVQTLFEAPTIDALATALLELLLQREPGTGAQLMDEVEQLSDADVRAQLRQAGLAPEE